MRKVIIIASCVAVFFICCKQTTENIRDKYLTTNNLPIQSFLINTDRDTAIITSKGIKIFIPANSIETKSGKVTLQIKEALSLEDMIKAGLTTESDNRVLSSNSMFYISTKENAVIKTTLQISVPTFFVNDNMRLYKGKVENGKINWTDPLSIDKKITALTDLGQALFANSCAPCHRIDKKLVGPALAWMDKRNVDEKTLYAFIKNSNEIIKSGNSYYNCLYCSYNKTLMTRFPALADSDIAAIVRYVDKESKRLGIPEDFNPNSECDSCTYYHRYYIALKKTRDSLIEGGGKMSETTIVQPPDADPNADNGIIPIKVNPPKYNAEYYQFKINGFGWYNIDDLLDIKFSAQESKLTISVQGLAVNKMNIFLVIPSYKVFNEGGLLQNDKDWGFYIDNGEIYLPQKAKAFVFGISEQNGKLYYGERHFVTSTLQHLRLTLNETTKEKMLNSFGSTMPDSLYLQVEKTKNFDSLKTIDKELKKLQMKVSQCSCTPVLNSDSAYGDFKNRY